MLLGLGNILREKGVSGKKLSEHMGVEPNTVYRWVSCQIDPGTGKARDIAMFLGVSIDMLTNPPQPSLPTEAQGSERAEAESKAVA